MTLVVLYFPTHCLVNKNKDVHEKILIFLQYLLYLSMFLLLFFNSNSIFS